MKNGRLLMLKEEMLTPRTAIDYDITIMMT